MLYTAQGRGALRAITWEGDGVTDILVMRDEPASPAQAAPEAPQTPRVRGFALASVLGTAMLTLLLEALDQTVVSTALPRIIGSFQGFDRYI